MNTVEWLKKAVFYNIYPQSFKDSNGDGVGDLKGITEKLDYVSSMGFSAVWLNPFYESPFRDAGYDVTDFYKVAPRYGTNEDFRVLCSRAHELGIKVCIDLVIGHTSLECEWFKKSCSNEKNEYTNRYIWTDDWGKSPDGSFINGYAERNGNYMKNFFYSQPALNYGYMRITDPSWQLPIEHPDCVETKQEMIRVMEYWISLGCDGFRVDMAASVIKNDYEDGRGVIAFWQEIRKLFDVKYPECVLISEWSKPEMALKAGFHVDFMIHFNSPAYTRLFRAEHGRNVNDTYLGSSYFDKAGKGNIEDFLKEYLDQYDKTKELGFISIPTGNHDIPRISYRRTTEEIKLVMVFVLTMAGVPFVYYGDEIGMRYLPDLKSVEGGYNRTGSRTPMQWNRNEMNCGFSALEKEAELYIPMDGSMDKPDVQSQEGDRGSLLELVKTLNRLHRNHPALDADAEISFLNRTGKGYPLVYMRKKSNRCLLILINPTGSAQEYQLMDEPGEYSIILQCGSTACSNGLFRLEAVSCCIADMNTK